MPNPAGSLCGVDALAAEDHALLPSPAVIVDRYGPYLERLLGRMIGWDPELPDLLQDVFLQAFQYMNHLKNPAAVRTWLGRIAIWTACVFIRRRRRRRSFIVLPIDELPEPIAIGSDPEIRAALQHVDGVLAALPVNDRIAFVERFVDGMKLREMADAHGVSLSTIKRILSRAEKRFLLLSGRDPLLREHLEGSSRWGLDGAQRG